MEDFWLYNFNILLEGWNKIFPQKNMSRNEFLNSLTRFGLITFILFLIISHFIGIIKLSFPLVLIYLVFCLSYLINQDSEEKAITDVIIDAETDKYVPDDYAKDIKNKENLKLKSPQTNNFEKEKIKEISKPVVFQESGH